MFGYSCIFMSRVYNKLLLTDINCTTRYASFNDKQGLHKFILGSHFRLESWKLSLSIFWMGRKREKERERDRRIVQLVRSDAWISSQHWDWQLDKSILRGKKIWEKRILTASPAWDQSHHVLFMSEVIYNIPTEPQRFWLAWENCKNLS